MLVRVMSILFVCSVKENPLDQKHIIMLGFTFTHNLASLEELVFPYLERIIQYHLHDMEDTLHVCFLNKFPCFRRASQGSSFHSQRRIQDRYFNSFRFLSYTINIFRNRRFSYNGKHIKR